MLTVSQLAPLKSSDPYLYETLTKIVAAVNAASQSSGVDPPTLSLVPALGPRPQYELTRLLDFSRQFQVLSAELRGINRNAAASTDSPFLL